MRADAIAALAGLFGLAMVLGALFFQYVIGVAPCEVCYWQRYPHIAAAVIGLPAALAYYLGKIGEKPMTILTVVTLAILAVAGILGIYHSGVEWKIWAGPDACTGDRIEINLMTMQNLDAAPVVRCDVVAWKFLGIFSLANLNAVFSLGTAGLGALLLRKRDLAAKTLAALLHKG